MESEVSESGQVSVRQECVRSPWPFRPGKDGAVGGNGGKY